MILAVIQARLSSSRLPGKVLKPILGRPMLELQLERVALSKRVDRTMVATSSMPDDAALEGLCARLGVPCYRGSLDNVLDRFYQAAMTQAPTHVVRITGDCPLIDPGVVDQVVELHLSGSYDYTSNVLPPSFPDGLDVEVMKLSVLKRAWEEAKLPSQIEHVTPFINRQPELFKLGNLTAPQDLSSMRWTVDEAPDLELVSRIYKSLYEANPRFGYRDVLELLRRNPSWLDLNSRFARNEGFEKSLEKDKKFAGGN